MKTVISIVIMLVIYGSSLLIKNRQIEDKKSKYIATTYDLQKKNGIPVLVDHVQRGKFQNFLTISGTISQGQLLAHVSPSVRRQIQVGKAAKLHLQGDRRSIPGRVSSVANGPSLLSGLYEVRVSLDKGVSKDLGSVTVDIPIKEISNVLMIPREAVSARESTPAVFVIEDKKLVRKEVEIAGANPDVYWIKSGLRENEVVITSDNRYFNGGELVKVMNETRKEL